MSLESEILASITPSDLDKDHLKSSSERLLIELRGDYQVIEHNIDVMLVGSVAKGTYLCNPDIDLFLLFPENTDKEVMQKIGLEIGKNHLEQCEERYAEHPYMHGIRYGYELDIVPCYKIKSTADLKCAVDRTPFHTKYIQTIMTDEMKDEVRLLKQFTKGIGTYGAEAKIEGMSGYLIELLIAKYGSFLEVLNAAASEWKQGYVVFPKNNRKFPGDALVVHDPIDNNRNVASALSLESFTKFIYAAKEYLKGPSSLFFFPRQRHLLSVNEVKNTILKRGTYLIIIELNKPDLIDDNLYPQVRKTLEGLLDVLQNENVTLFDHSYHITESKVQYSLEVDDLLLPVLIPHRGPPIWSENVRPFLEKWENNEFKPFMRRGCWEVMICRDERSVAKHIQKNLKNAALGKDFRNLKGLQVLDDQEKICEEKYMAVVSAMLDKRMNWEIV